MKQNHPKGINAKRAAVIFFGILLIGAVIMLVAEFLDRLIVPMNEEVVATREVMEMDATRTKLMDDIRFNAEQGEGKLALIFFHGKQENRVTNYGEMDKHDAAINQAIASITPLHTGADEKVVLSQLVALRESYRNNLLQAVDALELNDREQAQTIFSTLLLGNLRDMKTLVAQLVKGHQDSMSARQTEMLARKIAAEATLSRSRAVIIGVGLAAAIIILLLGLVLMRRISTPD